MPCYIFSMFTCEFCPQHSSWEEDNWSAGSSSSCPIYAVFKEATAVEYLRVCGNRDREKHVYTSTSNHLEVHIVNMQEKPSGSSFMLKYKGNFVK